jgi:RecA-family ATPase
MPFVSLSDIKPVRVDWLVPGRLARGHLHLLDGDPDLGKSLVLLDLAARLTTGRPFAEGIDGARGGPATAVVVLNAEDGARDTVVPRLLAAGADLGRIAYFERRPGERGIRLPSQIDLLGDIVRQKEASLVVLDPMLGFLDASVNIGSDPLVRQALGPLADLAARAAVPSCCYVI